MALAIKSISLAVRKLVLKGKSLKVSLKLSGIFFGFDFIHQRRE